MFWDSDSGKWLEAVAYSLHTNPDPALEKQADDLIDLIASALMQIPLIIFYRLDHRHQSHRLQSE
ncbi:MAG: glycoside hydrolase family 127 protein [Anaerolineae bacterium]|nr:glycoside hydrolase family 127 protein [Anaerolineae bacterium]